MSLITNVIPESTYTHAEIKEYGVENVAFSVDPIVVNILSSIDSEKEIVKLSGVNRFFYSLTPTVLKKRLKQMSRITLKHLNVFQKALKLDSKDIAGVLKLCAPPRILDLY